MDSCQLSLEITNVLKWDLRCLDARGSLFLPGSFCSTRSAVWISPRVSNHEPKYELVKSHLGLTTRVSGAAAASRWWRPLNPRHTALGDATATPSARASRAFFRANPCTFAFSRLYHLEWMKSIQAALRSGVCHFGQLLKR